MKDMLLVSAMLTWGGLFLWAFLPFSPMEPSNWWIVPMFVIYGWFALALSMKVGEGE